MSNFYTDNQDLVFTLKNLDLEEVVAVREHDYTDAQKFDGSPENFADAMDNYERVLTVVGDVAGERIAPRSRQIDEEGPHFENGVVTYHPLTVKNLEDLHRAGMTESKKIIAVNTDPAAPIFSVAHYGIIGDLNSVIPMMIKAYKAKA